MKIVLTFDEMVEMVAFGLKAKHGLTLYTKSNDPSDYVVVSNSDGETIEDYTGLMFDCELAEDAPAQP